MKDSITLGLGALRGHKQRSLLSTLGIAIGITSVMLLTAIGEGTRAYVVGQFSQFGTNIIGINPGKTETAGIPGLLGGTTQKLSLEDADALRSIPGVELVMPFSFGLARVEAEGRGRSVPIYGVTAELPELWKWRIGSGSFLPPGDSNRGGTICVLGSKMNSELFGSESGLGKFVRIAGARLRVIGVMQPKGQFLGIDLDDSAFIPVATALQLFNTDEVNEIDVTYAHEGQLNSVEAAIIARLTRRHAGREDFTVTTQEAMLSVFDTVMKVVTAAVGAIGGISLLVGAIGILTMMWISVGERTQEIGLLRAIGATSAQVSHLFIVEAIALSTLGGLVGIFFGTTIALAMRQLLPGIPLQTPPEFIVAAVVVSATTGLLAGVVPARRAAALDPVVALRAE